MYQVIARSWRPQKFSEVIGQKHVTETLQNAIRLGRIGHGYIFSGLRGTGKTTLARLLAKALNCKRGPAPEPCGECDSCREIAAGRSVDVIEIDAASNRGIDAVRELRENARYAPARDRYKIFIIDEAHQITTEGFNALLKTLEEPPAHVVFLLATTEVHQFPGTILSRCQHFALHALTYAEILNQLEKICAGEKIIADAEALAVLAKSGQGSLRDAQSRLEQAIAAFGERLEGPTLRRFLGEAPEALVEDVFRAVKEQKRERMLAVVESLVEDGYQLPHFCTQLVRTARNLLVVQLSGPDQQLLESSAEQSQRLIELAEGFTQESLMRCLDILLQLHQQLRFSMEPRFQMELGLLKLVDADRLVAIEELLARGETNLANAPGSASASPPVQTGRASLSGGVSTGAPRSPQPGSQTGERSPEKKLTPWEQDQLRKRQAQGESTIDPGARETSRSIAVASNDTAASESPSSPPPGPTSVVADDGAASVSVPAMETELSGEEENGIQNILQQLEEQSRFMLHSLLSQAKRWEFTETEVRISLGDAQLAKVFTESDRKYLEQLLSAVLGRKLKVRLVEDTRPGMPAPAARARSAPSGAARKPAPGSVESRVRQDPEIQEFEKLFGKPVTVTRNWKE